MAKKIDRLSDQLKGAQRLGFGKQTKKADAIESEGARKPLRPTQYYLPAKPDRDEPRPKK